MEEFETVAYRLLFAVLAGIAIGLERTHHGRPAGLRTHTLVCVSSCLLMLFTVFQWRLLSSVPLDAIRIDPTRMAQGIMTGIGFLGAGVIMKDRYTIRGLTTAGSIWMTASIGIIIGVGLYFAAVAATVITLVILGLFRFIEMKVPTMHYGKLSVHFKAADALNQKEVYSLLKENKVFGFSPSFNLYDDGRLFKYDMTVRTFNFDNFECLSDDLRSRDVVKEFSLIPTGD